MKSQTVYVGTYTDSGSEGIHAFRLLPTGRLVLKAIIPAGPNPSFLAVRPGSGDIFGINETAGTGESGTGTVRRMVPSGTEVRSTGGSYPCHLSFDPSGRSLYVSHYGSGSVAGFDVGPEGAIGDPADLLVFTGSGPVGGRQESPHAHCCLTTRSGLYALVCDLGSDRLRVYRRDPSTGRLTSCGRSACAMKDGSGPRHLLMDPDDRTGYVVNELDSTLTVFGFDPADGSVTIRETVGTVPAGFNGANHPAGIASREDLLFVSNRGHDSIAVFRTPGSASVIEPIGYFPCSGNGPRSICVDETGTFLISANFDSDSVSVLVIEPGSAGLTPVGRPVKVPRPACVLAV